MECEKYITIKQNSMSDITVKKSKFIAQVFYVETANDAEKIIKEIQKKEHKARHNCFAYRVIEDNILEKMSDDGEPSGTAGAPMLSILKGRKLVNTLAVVTRYFGGILLGTGGLVKAYSESLTNALDNAGTKEMQKVTEISFFTDYSEIESIKRYIAQINGKCIAFDYNDNIKVSLLIPNDFVKIFQNEYQKLPFKLKNLKILSEKNADI